jgi:hypothetical protein
MCPYDPNRNYRSHTDFQATLSPTLYGNRGVPLKCIPVPWFTRQKIHRQFELHVKLKSSAEICALIRYYVAYSGNSLTTFRDNLSVSSSRLKTYQEIQLMLYTTTLKTGYQFHFATESKSWRRVPLWGLMSRWRKRISKRDSKYVTVSLFIVKSLLQKIIMGLQTALLTPSRA